MLKRQPSFQAPRSQDHIYEEVDSGVENDQGVRDVIDGVQPVGPLSGSFNITVPAFIEGRNEFPNVRKYKKPNNAQRYACQPILFGAQIIA